MAETIDTAGNVIGMPAKPDGLPDGFRLRRNGIERRVDGKGDEPPRWVWLCSPIRVLSLPRDTDGKGWGRYVEITDPDGRAHRWAIPAEMLAGDGLDLRCEAYRLGLDLAPGGHARNAFLTLLACWKPKARATTTARLGWTDAACGAFALGDGRVLGDGSVVYQSESAADAAAEMRGRGTLADWRASVAAPCRGNPILLASVSLAFAGALLEPLGAEGGGLHLRGQSSAGKSTAQRAAVSVWGSPAFLRTWRATANGLEGTALACNATLLALDEMGEVSGREAGQAAYMLANGQGKARASRTGTARPSARWRTAILSSGEIRLADKMAEANQRARAGQDVRLLDVQADGRAFGAFDTLHGHADGRAFADAVNRAAAVSYGTAGPAFVAALVADLDGARAKARALCDGFVRLAREDHGELDGQTGRAASRFGLIAAAGELATSFGLTGWCEGEAREAAAELFAAWLDGRGGAGPAEAREAVERVRAFLVSHGAARFEMVAEDFDTGPSGAAPIRDRAGWRTGGLFLIAPDVWSREVHAGSDAKRAARHVRDAGFLDCPDGDRLTYRTPRAVPGRPRVYAVRREIMGAGDD